MSTLCSKYYMFLENTLDFNRLLNKMSSEYDYLMNCCLQPDFINCNVQELIDCFPKYLDYSIFTNVNKLSSGYNHDLIYNATTMTYSQLANEVSKDPFLFSLDTQIKRTPEYIDDQIKEYLFQINYFTSIDSLIFNRDFYYNNYKSNNYSDRFSNLITQFNEDNLSYIRRSMLNRNGFFHLYFLNSLVNYIFGERSNFREILLLNSKDLALPTINNSIETYFENIVDVVLLNQFSFINITTSFKEKVYQSTPIIESVTELETLFKDYINDHITDNKPYFREDVLETVFQIISQSVSFDNLKKTFGSNSYFNYQRINDLFSNSTFTPQAVQDLMNLYSIESDLTGNNLSNFENDLYVFFIKLLNNNYSMKNYYYLLYSYRMKLQRFVSVLDLVATDYVDSNIQFDGLSHFSTFENMSTLFNQWVSCLRNLRIINTLNTVITSGKIQSFLDNDPNILEMAQTYAYQKQIESFVNTTTFKTQVNKIQNAIYSYLRSSGILSENIDWCNCSKPLEVYLFFVFKKLITNTSTTVLYTYLKDTLEFFDYKKIENEEQFLLITENFNIETSYYLFEFYKAFTKSLITASFSNALHSKYSL